MTYDQRYPHLPSPHQSGYIEADPKTRTHKLDNIHLVSDPTEGAHPTSYRDTIVFWTATLGPSSTALLVILDDLARNDPDTIVSIHDLSALIGNPNINDRTPNTIHRLRRRHQ